MEPETPGPVMAAKVVSHAIAATAGALLGGGAGAVAGAAFAPVLEEMLRRGDRAYADSVYRALEAASETADMSADEMAGAIRVHDRYLALSTATVQVALNTLNEQKVAGLSRA